MMHRSSPDWRSSFEGWQMGKKLLYYAHQQSMAQASRAIKELMLITNLKEIQVREGLGNGYVKEEYIQNCCDFS